MIDEERRTYDEAYIENLVEKAATRAAQKAVAAAFESINLPLNDKTTGKDIADLRGLMTAWRAAKNQAFLEFIKMLMHWAFFGGSLWVAFKLGLGNVIMSWAGAGTK